MALETAAIIIPLALRTPTLSAIAGPAVLTGALAVARRRGRSPYEWWSANRDLRRRKHIGWDVGGPGAILARWDITDEPGRTGEPVAILRDELGYSAILGVTPAGILSTSSSLPWSVLLDTLRDPVLPAAVQLVIDTGPDETRRWWLALRLDPTRSTTAIAARGGGQPGARRALRAAALRLAARLTTNGLAARPLTATEARSVLTLATAALADTTETRTGWRTPDTTHRCFTLRRHLDRLPSLCATEGTLSITLTPTGCQLLLRTTGRPPGLSPLDAHHGPALISTVPLAIPLPHRLATHPIDETLLSTLDTLTRTASPGDVLLGYGTNSQPVLARLHRPVPTTIALLGNRYAAAVLAHRAAEAGTRTTIVTDHPDTWYPVPQVTITAPGMEDTSASPAEPVLSALDHDVPGPAAAPWLTVMRVMTADPATARALHAADLVCTHQIDNAQAGFLSTALNIPANETHWLANGPADGIAIVTPGTPTSFLLLASTEEEAAWRRPMSHH